MNDENFQYSIEKLTDYKYRLMIGKLDTKEIIYDEVLYGYGSGSILSLKDDIINNEIMNIFIQKELYGQEI